MRAEHEPLEESAEDLFEQAPCGYLLTRVDGTIMRVNRTFERWTGLGREQLIGERRLQDILSPGSRIYYETHYAPLLHMQGSVREVAVEILRADGSRLPALVNSVMRHDEGGRPRLVRTTVFDASDRRRYEEELRRARRREQETAQLLQRSLLAGELPHAATLEVGVAYRPGVDGLEAGGDWYDGFWLADDDTVGLVVGDVVGRGIEAAATMGQLRSAVRALASTGLPPGRLLDALDEYVRRHGVGSMATLVYAELNLPARTMRFACAGHPPPALVPVDGAAEFLWGGRSAPLDADPYAAPRAEAHVDLDQGGMVVLYSDGLVERRSRDLDEGLERLLAAVSRRREEPPSVITGQVFNALHDGDHGDDTCLLVARLAPGFGDPVSAEPHRDVDSGRT